MSFVIFLRSPWTLNCNIKLVTVLFNSLWPSDTIWRHRSESTLVQVLACCLTAPSHHLNQCWLIVSKVQRHSAERNFTKNNSNTKVSLKITYPKFYSNLPGTKELITQGNIVNICLCYHITKRLIVNAIDMWLSPPLWYDIRCKYQQ